MKYLSIISGIFLLCVAFFWWGFSAGAYETYPGAKIKEICDEVAAFVRGGESDEKSIGEKLANDMGIRPDRLMENASLNENRVYQPLPIEGLKKRRALPLVFADRKNTFPPGYLLIWGAFDFETHIHGAILLDENLRMVHRWIPDEEAFIEEVKAYNEKMIQEGREEVSYIPTQLTFPQGLAVFPDGSLIFNDSDPGNGMQKIDYLSNVQWIKLGSFNHIISKDESGAKIWAIEGNDRLHRIDTTSGMSLTIIKVQDIMKANSDCSLLSIRRNFISGEWIYDPWHFNDIEVLPVDYESAFPQFHPGDLLMSMRALHAIMVVDPNSLKIKWWRAGSFIQQHDPDWQKSGLITVYDNNTRDKYRIGHYLGRERYSRIVSIDVNNYKTEVLYDGNTDQFYSSIRGKHQFLPNGNILITSSMQGRIFIVDGDGRTVFEIVNMYDEKKALLVSEAIWLPKDFFAFDTSEKNPLKAGTDKSRAKWHPGQNLSLHSSASQTPLKQHIEGLPPVPLEMELPFVDNPFLVFDGWSGPENLFRWSTGHDAFLHFSLPEEVSEQNVLVQLSIHTLGRQKIRVSCNGKFIKLFDVEIARPEKISFHIPASVISSSELNMLAFEFPDARSPDSPDQRVLAMALHGIEFDLYRKQ